MSRLKAGLGMLSAITLCACAIGASGASALTLEECVAEGSGAACETGKKWTPIVGKQTIKPTGMGVVYLNASFGIVELEIQCAGSSGTGKAENATVGGDMVVAGSEITIVYHECQATKPVGGVCSVPATITTNSLKSETLATTGRQKYMPTEGSTLLTIEVTGASCPAALKGIKSLTGSMVAEVNQVTGEQKFTILSGSELKFGGEKATLIGSNKFDTSDGTQVFPHEPC